MALQGNDQKAGVPSPGDIQLLTAVLTVVPLMGMPQLDSLGVRSCFRLVDRADQAGTRCCTGYIHRGRVVQADSVLVQEVEDRLELENCQLEVGSRSCRPCRWDTELNKFLNDSGWMDIYIYIYIQGASHHVSPKSSKGSRDMTSRNHSRSFGTPCILKKAYLARLLRLVARGITGVTWITSWISRVSGRTHWA
jgi:hypothetical protein